MTAMARHPSEKGLALSLALFGTLLVGSCATPQVAAPPPRQVTVLPPTPKPPPVFQGDWRDAPQTAGNWTWSMTDGQSSATFGQAGKPGLVVLTCDRADGRVLLARAGSASGAVPFAVRSTSSLRPLASDPRISPPGWVVAALPARDPMLDAMAFSRGRFTVEVAGLETLYLPSWPEVARVVEDCR